MSNEIEEKMLRHVQSLAQGMLLEFLLSAHFKHSSDPIKAADDLLAIAEQISDQMTFPEAGPEWSDLAAQEFRDSLVRHIHRAKAVATGEPFDPTAFHKRAKGSNLERP